MTDRPPTSEYQPVWSRQAAMEAEQRKAPSFKRLILNLIVIGLVGAGVSFVVAPAVAFFGIRAAAEANDVQGLGRLIDYGALRASLRPQLSGRPEPMTPAPSFLEDPIGAVRRQFEQARPVAPAAPDVEAFLTPDALLGLMAGEGREADAATAPAADPPWPHPVFWSFNRARLAVEGRGRTIFTFERKGLFEWKLVHVGLPDPAAQPPRNPS